MRRMLADALGRQGFDVVATAGDGDEALAACREHRPDALTLDLAMPGLDGLAPCAPAASAPCRSSWWSPPPTARASELEVSAVSEVMNQMMATAAGAISTVLGTEVEIGTPETRTFATEAEGDGAYPPSPHMVRAAFSVCGEPCRLVQLVPNAFVVRMDRALDELGAETAPASGATAAPASSGSPHGAPSLAGIPVRVWAELGRASMQTADVAGLPHGAVVELDRAPDEPIDLFVNGRRFGTSGNSSDTEGEVARCRVSS